MPEILVRIIHAPDETVRGRVCHSLSSLLSFLKNFSVSRFFCLPRRLAAALSCCGICRLERQTLSQPGEVPPGVHHSRAFPDCKLPIENFQFSIFNATAKVAAGVSPAVEGGILPPGPGPQLSGLLAGMPHSYPGEPPAARSERSGSARVLALLLSLACFFLLSPHAVAADQQPGSTPKKARILLVTGIDYPGHLWKQTAPVLAEALRDDARLEVAIVEDPHFLDSTALMNYDAVLLHFQNWEQKGPGEAARANLKRFVASGKGIVLVHFACGAWHGEWPEFADLAGRVWFGANPGPGKRQHDPYGPFTVEMVKSAHPIVQGLADFETQDELYTCLIGDHPIQVVAQAKSKVDRQYYPMAFVSNYGQGRTFHCILGHDAKALKVPGVQELYRRGCAWAAGLTPVATTK
jgi:uncharacterized protein